MPTTHPRFELFFGRADALVARVYARLLDPVDLGVAVVGELRGPFCKFARTLPAEMRFQDAGPGAAPLAEAVLVDPCFWTPELPFYYRARVRLQHGSEVLASYDRMFGIRPLAASGRDLRMAGRRIVLRGVRRSLLPDEPIAAWREAGAVMYVAQPDDALCAAASEEGVLLVARIESARDECQQELDRLGQWPAVGVAVLPAGEVALALRRPKNLLLAHRFRPGAETDKASEADVLVSVSSDVNELGTHVQQASLPLLALRPCKQATTLQQARAECDRLQLGLAPHGDCAGYFV